MKQEKEREFNLKIRKEDYFILIGVLSSSNNPALENIASNFNRQLIKQELDNGRNPLNLLQN
jgi:hypothetical protein